MSHRQSRRRFLRTSAAIAAAFAAGPRLAAAGAKLAANDKLNLAVIGVGGQGTYSLHNVQHENIVALCDVDSERKDVVEARKAHPKAEFTQDFRRVLDRKDLDAVVVATPDHWHAIPAVWAMRAGKHIYCEKPLAHSVHEIRVMMQTAADKKLVTQMGTQIHAEDNYRRAVEIVQAGVLGPVRRVHVWCQKQPEVRHLNYKGPLPKGLDYEMWLGPAPRRPYDPAFLPFHWRWWWDFGGGILADMACHYMDLAHWALDLRTPTTAEATGRKIKPGDHDVPDILQADYHYPERGDRPPVHLTWYSGVQGPKLDPKGPAFHGFPNGVLFEGDKGQMVVDYGRYLLLPEKQFDGFMPPKPTIPKSIGHHREWLEAIRTGGPTTCNFAYSGALAETVLLGNVAFRSGRKIQWDDKAGKTDSAEADKWLRREYRGKWQL